MKVTELVEEAMKLYHATSEDAALDILKHGFKNESLPDGVIIPKNISVTPGVFLSDQPLDQNEGVRSSDTLLEVTLRKNFVLDYEIIEKGKPYREFMIPATLVNKNGRIRKLNPREIDRIHERRFARL